MGRPLRLRTVSAEYKSLVNAVFLDKVLLCISADQRLDVSFEVQTDVFPDRNALLLDALQNHLASTIRKLVHVIFET